MSHGVPEVRRRLPLVEKARRRAFEDSAGVDLGDLPCVGIVELGLRAGETATEPGLAAAAGAFDENGRSGLQAGLDLAFSGPRSVSVRGQVHAVVAPALVGSGADAPFPLHRM